MHFRNTMLLPKRRQMGCNDCKFIKRKHDLWCSILTAMFLEDVHNCYGAMFDCSKRRFESFRNIWKPPQFGGSVAPLCHYRQCFKQWKPYRNKISIFFIKMKQMLQDTEVRVVTQWLGRLSMTRFKDTFPTPWLMVNYNSEIGRFRFVVNA
jgi:hypothetical protein